MRSEQMRTRESERNRVIYSSDNQAEEREREGKRRCQSASSIMLFETQTLLSIERRSSNEYEDELLRIKMNF